VAGRNAIDPTKRVVRATPLGGFAKKDAVVGRNASYIGIRPLGVGVEQRRRA